MEKREVIRTVKRLGGKVTKSMWATVLGADPPTAYKHLQKLRADGLLTLQGSKRGSHYVLTPPPSTPPM